MSVELNVLLDCFVFASKDQPHTFNQSDAKLKSITTWSPAFSRALGNLVGFTLKSLWLLKIICFHVISRCDYFGFGCTTLSRNAL